MGGISMFLVSSIRYVLAIALVAISFAAAKEVSIIGKVQNSLGVGIEGAQVKILARYISAVTDITGAFKLEDIPSGVAVQLRGRSFAPMLVGSEIRFGVLSEVEKVSVEVYNAMGRMVCPAFTQSLERGNYAINPLTQNLSVQVYFVKLKTGNFSQIFKMPVFNSLAHRVTGLRKLNTGGSTALAKTAATVDTITASKIGYISKRIPIDSFSGSYTITLENSAFDLVYPRNGSRVFKSPGGSIIFEWTPLAGATSYDVSVDGATVATGIPGVVPFASTPITKFATMNVPHSWQVVATTAAGTKTSDAFTFTLATAVDGTTGAPFGGLGAGAVKFCPWQGNFAFQAASPPGRKHNSGDENKDYKAQNDMKFSLYTKRGTAVVAVDRMTSKITSNRSDDDAAYPVQYANFGDNNGVSVTMTAASPFYRDSAQKMTYPLAFYQFTVYNNQATPVDAAIAFQTNTAAAPTLVTGKGFAAGGGTERAIFAKSNDAAAVISAGNDNGFQTTGECNNTVGGTINKVAAKVLLAPGEKKDLKFVFAWYKSDDKASFYYTNFGASAKAFAEVGLNDFDKYRDRAVEFVERSRSGNVPDWMLNQTMNQVVWVNNSQYRADGRYGITEGVYEWMGQMDQGWHAFASTTWKVPEVTWQWKNASELEFFSRIMCNGGGGCPDGQISHDFDKMSFCAWDAVGYHGWGDAGWVDVNCGYIFGVYEGFLATGDKARMDYYWPFMKRTGNRLLGLADQGSFLINGGGATYDKGPMDHGLYNSGLTTTAFKVMEVMSEVYKETELRDKYRNAATKAAASFQKKYLDGPNFGGDQEVALAGLWMSLHLGLGQQFSDAAIDKGVDNLVKAWNPLEKGMDAGGGSGEDRGWVPYLLSHLAGAMLMTDRVAEWRALERDCHNRIITNRDLVYNSTIYLAYQGRKENYQSKNISGGDFYCSYPVLWRNYMGFTGFLYNAYSGELWLQPRLPNVKDKWGESMNHELKDAFICIPGTYGSLNYKETGATFLKKEITVKFDKPTKVSCIYLKDNYTDAPTVIVDGVEQKVDRIGTGKYDKMLKVNWTGNIGPNGIRLYAGN
jgi:hypothetical protein